MSMFPRDISNIIQTYADPFRTVFTGRMTDVEKNQFLSQYDYDFKTTGIEPACEFYYYYLSLAQVLDIFTIPEDQTFFLNMVLKYKFNIIKLKYQRDQYIPSKTIKIHIKFYSSLNPSLNKTNEEDCFKNTKDFLVNRHGEDLLIATIWDRTNVMNTTFYFQ